MTTPPLEAAEDALRGLGATRGSRLNDIDPIGWRRRLGFDLLGRLVLAKALERGLPDHACTGEPGKLDLGHQFRLQPMHSGLLARCILAAERVRLRSGGLELRHQTRDLLGTVARSDIADVDEVIAPIHAGHQRFELAAVAVPAADDHLVSGAALGLGPGVRPSGSVTGGGLLRDDPFQRHPASGFEDRFTAALEMLDVADFGLVFSVSLFNQLL